MLYIYKDNAVRARKYKNKTKQNLASFGQRVLSQVGPGNFGTGKCKIWTQVYVYFSPESPKSSDLKSGAKISSLKGVKRSELSDPA